MFRAGDVETPEVSLINPTNGTSGNDLSMLFEFKFNEPVKNVNFSSIKLHEGSITGAQVKFEDIVRGDANTYTISTVEKLKENTIYYLTFTDDIIDESGNKLTNATFYFTTGDFSIPEIIMIYPLNGAHDVNPSLLLQFRSSEPIEGVDKNSIGLYNSSNTAINIRNIDHSISTNVYTVSFTSRLSSFHNYRFSIDSQKIFDEGNNFLSVFSNVSFKTSDVVNPTVQVVSPSYGAVNVGINGTVELRFSEPVTNVNGNTVKLYESTDSGISQISWSGTSVSNNYTRANFDFASLKYITNYFVEISSNIKDQNGNHITSKIVYFRTAYPEPLKIEDIQCNLEDKGGYVIMLCRYWVNQTIRFVKMSYAYAMEYYDPGFGWDHASAVDVYFDNAEHTQFHAAVYYIKGNSWVNVKIEAYRNIKFTITEIADMYDRGLEGSHDHLYRFPHW